MGSRRRASTPLYRQQQAGAPRLAIGALARATGIPVDTIRTWERRYGYPEPQRKPSGHRVYAAASVTRLQRISRALALGHRPAEVVPASDASLDTLLGQPPDSSAYQAHRDDSRVLLSFIESFDGEALTRTLTAEWARLGPIGFLEQSVAPLLHDIGEAWATGRLGVAHEHFAAEKVDDLLRALRLPIEARTQGPLVLLATLPGELHGLGLQMAALALATAGCRVCNLGTDVPIAEIARRAREIGAQAVALSMSRCEPRRRAAERLDRLRRAVPKRIKLAVGGSGAPASRAGVDTISSLGGLADWGRELAGYRIGASGHETRQ